MKRLFFSIYLLAIAGIAVAQKDTSFNVQRGIDYYENGDNKNAFVIFDNAAKRGNAYAMCVLGYMYDVGDGVEEDDVKEYLKTILRQQDGTEKQQNKVIKNLKNALEFVMRKALV